MNWSALQLRYMALVGPRKAPAALEFAPGINVVCGASDTGKSFIVEAIDFLLGGSGPLRDIPERVGYDRGRLAVSTHDRGDVTFDRSVQGGEFSMYAGLFVGREPDVEAKSLGAKHVHNREENLSGWLLARIGLLGKRIRKNVKGETQSLSFRDLARLVIVQEEEIIRRGSPFLTGQYVSKTSEYSALKLLLTGVDDSSLVSEPSESQRGGNRAAKVELIEQWLADLNTEISDIGAVRADVVDQLNRLDTSIEKERAQLQNVQARVDGAIAKRREAYGEREKIQSRIDEIQELLERFDLLDRHYKVDLERLIAIQESGSLFVHQEMTACPLCGAEPEHQHIGEQCEGDVEPIVQAASAEIDKIKLLSRELTQTVSELQGESAELAGRVKDIDTRYHEIDRQIRETISPDLGVARATFGELVEKRAQAKKVLELFERIDRLESQKTELVSETESVEPAEKTTTDLSKTVLAELSETIERILRAWHFPGANRVYFDESALDFVIDGKPRGSRGKGLRAITHAAVSIGLMEYCRDKALQHPGFVVLDSPLLAYWAPEGKEDDLTGTDLKDRFYDYLVDNHRDNQVIIIENEHPPERLSKDIALTIFTKNPAQGRYGLFGHE
ncbi:MAG: AAA family ATPase [Sulfuricaulis sp.]